MRACGTSSSREGVAQHLALAAALLEGLLAALQLVAHVAHAVLGHGGLAGDAVAGRSAPPRAAARTRPAPPAASPGARSISWPRAARRGDPLAQLLVVLGQPPALGLGGRRRARAAPPAGSWPRRSGPGPPPRRRAPRPPPRRGRRAARCPRARSASAARSACSISASRTAAAPRSCSAWRALGVEDRGLAGEARQLLLGGGQVVADGHQVLLGGVDALLERSRLAGRGLRPSSCLRGRAAAGEESRLDHLPARRHLADLAPRAPAGPSRPRPPSTMEPRSVSPASVTQATGPWRSDDPERVLQRLDHQGVGQGSADAVGVRAR